MPSCTDQVPVYDLSILSNVPQPLQDSISTENGSARLRPLFNVGISDITRLETHEDGWLACTTDDILGEKKKLYDILVEMPPSTTAPGHKVWPKLRIPDSTVIKATQRDFRRYGSLRRELRKTTRRSSTGMHYHDAEPDGGEADENQDESAPLVESLNHSHEKDLTFPQSAEAEIVQPETWSAVAYRSFMWWASAGEKDAWEAEETLIDEALLDDLPDLDDFADFPSDEDGTREAQNVATILVAYFHRVTGVVLQTLTNIVERADDSTEEGYEEDAIEISEDDMRRMGTDPWSPRDRQFVQDAVKLYFNREAVIEDDGVRMCGMRIC